MRRESILALLGANDALAAIDEAITEPGWLGVDIKDRAGAMRRAMRKMGDEGMAMRAAVMQGALAVLLAELEAMGDAEGMSDITITGGTEGAWEALLETREGSA